MLETLGGGEEKIKRKQETITAKLLNKLMRKNYKELKILSALPN